MATYFHGSSEIQADGLQTLYLMNPNYIGYSDTQQPSAANMLFLNATPNSLNPTNLPNMPLQNQHFVGIPLPNMDQPILMIKTAPHCMPSLRSPDSNSGAAASSGGAADVTSQLGYGDKLFHLLSKVQQQPPVQAISPTSGDDMRVSGVLHRQHLQLHSCFWMRSLTLGRESRTDSGEETKEREKVNTISVAASTGEALSGGESSAKRGAELSTAQRQELQMKKAKLVNMLDESYTDLVVAYELEGGAKTISKQFRCLKDAISAQIKATSSSLGEEDCSGGKVEGSRLRFVDHQLRQQRALQQLGMIQHNAWRPQRGLPERAVSVLRAWLFEHFLHPYPKDSDKHMLAKQTGLTRSQVSNWFINARVRLWKPMVEEMYLEEIKDQEHNGSQDNTSKSEANKELGSKSTAAQESGATRVDQTNDFQSKQEKSTTQNASPAELSNSTMSTSPMGGSLQVQAGFNLIGSSEIEGMVQRSPKNQEAMTFRVHPVAFSQWTWNETRKPTKLPIQSKRSVGRRLEMGNGEPDYCGINAAQPSHSNAAYDSINIQNRKRFAAQLLPDFVADDFTEYPLHPLFLRPLQITSTISSNIAGKRRSMLDVKKEEKG
ncbi:BEL1-like homeodomain protein 1 [Vitis vinifera]|uniref:BEL1-like homeodomain protein 1 n=1 Tax=Vitis vinifera TaxID=29760 RepID=A0A438D8G5_VITVI|nr:BEL1-like homeodomain protein 1 [Vitis vinifera]